MFPYELNRLFKLAQKNHTLKYAVFCLDLPTLVKPANASRSQTPGYLYRTVSIYDLAYLLKFGLILKNFSKTFCYNCLKRKEDANDFDLDKAFFWDNGNIQYGKEAVLKAFYPRKHSSKESDPNLLKNMLSSFDKNIYSLLKENQEVKFILFYPPYSILAWKIFAKGGVLKWYIKCKQEILAKVKTLKNVEVYDFQAEKDIILNLDYYKDYTHYGPPINSRMLSAIKDKQCKVDNDIYPQQLETLKSLIKNHHVLGYD